MTFIINIALKTGVIILLNWLGWITLLSNGTPAEGPKLIISTAIIVALIFVLVFVLVAFLSLGFALILGPFLGWLVLAIMGETAEGFIRLSDSGWLILVSGMLIGVASIPVRRREAIEA